MTLTIAFFNHKGGVGKTTMLFNAAIEMGRLDRRVLMVDLDARPTSPRSRSRTMR